MKRTALALALAVLSFLLLAMNAPEPQLPPLTVSVSVAPSTMDEYMLLKKRPAPNTYTCDAHVVQAGSGRALAGLKLIVEPGKKETVTQRAQKFDVAFTVSVHESRRRASTDVTIMRDGKILHQQKSSVMLAMVPPGRRPD